MNEKITIRNLKNKNKVQIYIGNIPTYFCFDKNEMGWLFSIVNDGIDISGTTSLCLTDSEAAHYINKIYDAANVIAELIIDHVGIDIWNSNDQ